MTSKAFVSRYDLERGWQRVDGQASITVFFHLLLFFLLFFPVEDGIKERHRRWWFDGVCVCVCVCVCVSYGNVLRQSRYRKRQGGFWGGFFPLGALA